MKMYELFLDKQPLGIFKEEPQDIVYCDGSTDGIDLLCFTADEWQKLQAKLNMVLTDDELDNFTKIMSSDFCQKNGIDYIDQLANKLDFGTLEIFDFERVEYAADMEEKYSYFIDGIAKTAGKADFRWDVACKGIHQQMSYVDRWVLSDSYYQIEVNELKGDELAQFDIKKIDEEMIKVSYGCQVQGYDLVSVKELDRKNPKDGVKLLVWQDGNTERSFLEYRLIEIKQEWLKK
ncbi:hypothetical protein [Campylobacter concisus]|uniref:hypothetical protein n=1 Tax=Campylobacter concisus TaxID=199 RepID=UPI00122CA60A|nr:hypothetical protein [Campylobacter concisus]